MEIRFAYTEANVCLKIQKITSCKTKLQHKKTLNLWPFLWMGFNCLIVIEPLRGGDILFLLGTQLMALGRMKGGVDLGATQWFRI